MFADIRFIPSLCHFIWEFLYLNFKHMENGIPLVASYIPFYSLMVDVLSNYFRNNVPRVLQVGPLGFLSAFFSI